MFNNPTTLGLCLVLVLLVIALIALVIKAKNKHIAMLEREREESKAIYYEVLSREQRLSAFRNNAEVLSIDGKTMVIFNLLPGLESFEAMACERPEKVARVFIIYDRFAQDFISIELEGKEGGIYAFEPPESKDPLRFEVDVFDGNRVFNNLFFASLPIKVFSIGKVA